MKIIKFLLFAVGVFVVLIALLWVVIHLWWLILAVVSLLIAYDLVRDKKDEEAKSDQPEEKSSTSNHPFEND